MKKRIVTIIRHKIGRKQCTGVFMVQDEHGQVLYYENSLERGWLNNQRNISCVPQGVYPLVLEWSNRFKTELWELKNVPNRSECKIHSANFWDDLNGCISPGLDLRDINGDGLLDTTSSRAALKKFHEVMIGFKKAEIRIINKRF